MQREVPVMVELMWVERRVGILVLIFWSYVGNSAGRTGIKMVERLSKSLMQKGSYIWISQMLSLCTFSSIEI